MKFYTIGVYGSKEEEFFKKLTDNSIELFIDIRQRRGVRGAKYSFVNSKRLQNKLLDLDIQYKHLLNLAPTKEIRELQLVADLKLRVNKRDREKLGEIFQKEYENKILDKFDFDSFIELLNEIGTNNIVLFCVEKNPDACHRSLVTNKLKQIGYNINHL